MNAKTHFFPTSACISYMLVVCLSVLGVLVSSCKTTEVEEAPTAQAQNGAQQASVTVKTDLAERNWQPPRSLQELTGAWIFKDGSGYEYPVTLEGTTYFSYHSQPLNRTQYWSQIANEYGMTFEELWQARATIQFADENGNAFPITDETGTRYVLRIRRDAHTGDIYFQYWYYVPEAVAGRNLAFFRLSPEKNQFYEEGQFVFRGTKISALKEGNQIYKKR